MYNCNNYDKEYSNFKTKLKTFNIIDFSVINTNYLIDNTNYNKYTICKWQCKL